MNPLDILGADERAVLRLRALYESSGYKKYKMNRFETYDLYLDNKNFLRSENIVTFTSPSGKLMALKPDTTLSIIRSLRESDNGGRFYYAENVYRADSRSDEVKEILQVGVEHIGTISQQTVCDVLCLACESLERLGSKYIVAVSNMKLIGTILDSYIASDLEKQDVQKLLSEKNAHELRQYTRKIGISQEAGERIATLTTLSGSSEDVFSRLETLFAGEREILACIAEMEALFAMLQQTRYSAHFTLDFSVLNDVSYYNGTVFQGFLDGVHGSVLSGGRYGSLLKKLGNKCGGIGFALYFDKLQRYFLESNMQKAAPSAPLRVALPKGRLGEKAYRIFKEAGYGCPEIETDSRKLIFFNPQANVCYFWAKPADVSVYVEHGAADVGVVGKDILEEHGSDVFELGDLGLGKCRMCVSGKRETRLDDDVPLRVATKFPNTARAYYDRQSRDIDIIKLNGSIEIAPLLDVSDVIVDIVETGTTLRENNLEPLEEMFSISTRFIANKSSYRFRKEQIESMLAAVLQAAGEVIK